ncbi:MAG: hypothetical protein ACT4PG_14175 [Panacagrimonas sp.]
MKSLRVLLLLGLFAGLSACVAPVGEDGQRESRAGEGRDETATIRNTENLGYSGNAIGGKVDAVLEINDNRPADLDRQIDQAMEEP